MNSLVVRRVRVTVALVLFCAFATLVSAVTTQAADPLFDSPPVNNIDVTSDSGITLDGNLTGDEKVNLPGITTTPTVTESTESSGIVRSVGVLVGFVVAAICLS